MCHWAADQGHEKAEAQVVQQSCESVESHLVQGHDGLRSPGDG